MYNIYIVQFHSLCSTNAHTRKRMYIDICMCIYIYIYNYLFFYLFIHHTHLCMCVYTCRTSHTGFRPFSSRPSAVRLLRCSPARGFPAPRFGQVEVPRESNLIPVIPSGSTWSAGMELLVGPKNHTTHGFWDSNGTLWNTVDLKSFMHDLKNPVLCYIRYQKA